MWECVVAVLLARSLDVPLFFGPTNCMEASKSRGANEVRRDETRGPRFALRSSTSTFTFWLPDAIVVIVLRCASAVMFGLDIPESAVIKKRLCIGRLRDIDNY